MLLSCRFEGFVATREVCELALAHVNSDRIEAAYRHSDLFDHRRALMDQWAAYVTSDSRGNCKDVLTSPTSRLRFLPLQLLTVPPCRAAREYVRMDQ